MKDDRTRACRISSVDRGERCKSILSKRFHRGSCGIRLRWAASGEFMIITLKSMNFLHASLERPTRLQCWRPQRRSFIYGSRVGEVVDDHPNHIFSNDWGNCRKLHAISLRDHTPLTERSQPKNDGRTKAIGPSVAVSHSLVCCSL